MAFVCLSGVVRLHSREKNALILNYVTRCIVKTGYGIDRDESISTPRVTVVVGGLDKEFNIFMKPRMFLFVLIIRLCGVKSICLMPSLSDVFPLLGRV